MTGYSLHFIKLGKTPFLESLLGLLINDASNPTRGRVQGGIDYPLPNK